MLNDATKQFSHDLIYPFCRLWIANFLSCLWYKLHSHMCLIRPVPPSSHSPPNLPSQWGGGCLPPTVVFRNFGFFSSPHQEGYCESNNVWEGQSSLSLRSIPGPRGQAESQTENANSRMRHQVCCPLLLWPCLRL